MIPLLDIQSYYEDPASFVEELREACHTVGCFLLRHDMPENVAPSSLLDEVRCFFQNPLEQKLAISYEHSPAFRGYMQLGVENTAGKTDVREQVEYAVETVASSDDGNNNSHFTNGASEEPLYKRLRGKNPWPDAFQPSLKPCTMEYVQQVCRIADRIREALCLALGLDKHALEPLFHDTTGSDPAHWVLKMVSYPACKDTTSFGVGPHTDTNFLTIVLQDTVGGLQVFSKGRWIDVPCEMGSRVLVCNLGEQAQMLSGGYFLATPHRVLSSQQQRISVPLFYNPKLSATVRPMIDKETSTLEWKRPRDYKHWKRQDNSMLETVGGNTFKSLARSHPQVFQKHHPDLKLLPDGRIIRRRNAEEEKKL